VGKRNGRTQAVALAACALAGLTVLAAPATAATAPAGGPSGIGLTAGGPAVLASAADYAKALTSPDWAATPDGLVYDSCVYQIPQGATLDTTRNQIVLASGATRKLPADCRYPRLVRAAQATAAGPAAASPSAASPGAITPDAATPGINDGLFVADMRQTYLFGYEPFNWFFEDIKVPAAPSPATSSTSYLMGGLAAFADNQWSDLLSVVGYGATRGNGGTTIGYNALWIASYYTWSGGVAVGSLRRVGAGDTIQASTDAAGSGCAGDCTWTVTTADLTNGQDSVLTVKSTPQYSWADGAGVASNGTHCNQLFYNGEGIFRNIQVGTPEFSGPVPLEWQIGGSQCSVTITANDTAINIVWLRN
jgi:hypothetical protein